MKNFTRGSFRSIKTHFGGREFKIICDVKFMIWMSMYLNSRDLCPLYTTDNPVYCSAVRLLQLSRAAIIALPANRQSPVHTIHTYLDTYTLSTLRIIRFSDYPPLSCIWRIKKSPSGELIRGYAWPKFDFFSLIFFFIKISFVELKRLLFICAFGKICISIENFLDFQRFSFFKNFIGPKKMLV